MTLELHATPGGGHARRRALRAVGAGQGVRKKPASASRWRWKNAAATSSTTPCTGIRSRNFKSRCEQTGEAGWSSNCAIAGRSLTRPQSPRASRRRKTRICPAAGASNWCGVYIDEILLPARSRRKHPAPDQTDCCRAGRTLAHQPKRATMSRVAPGPKMPICWIVSLCLGSPPR